MQRSTPPFRAEHVGSLIRPVKLRDAREVWMAGNMTANDLKKVEDACINEAVALQERVGLQAITDGEFRRPSWRDGFFDNVDGFSKEREAADFVFKLADGTTQRTSPVPHVVSRLVRRRGIATREFEYLKIVTRRMPKITLPAPSVMHFFRGGRSIDPAIYADVTEYMVDVARIYREELADLAALGCRYVQLDEVALPVMCDAGAQQIVRARGESVDRTIALYIDALNEAVRNRPAGMTIVVHMCRGNVGEGIASTGYDPIAERVFSSLNVDGFLLEYDTPRAGDFSPLRFLAKDKFALLGLISTKLPNVENANDLRRRIDAAAQVIPLERLGLCPQCGFASGFRTARLTIADEERKLANLVQVAEQVWG